MFEFDFAKEDITSVYGVPLCGRFNPRPNKGVLDPLSVKAAMFRCGRVTTGIVSLPAEPFTGIGLAIKKVFSAPLMIVAALEMGEVGYVRLSEHYCHGGDYETSPSLAKADRDVCVKIIDAAVRILN